MLGILTGIAIIVMSLWMLFGVVHLAFGLVRGFAQGWTVVAEQAILDALVILALMEVIRTFQAYLMLGRVRVTFIIDTALVVLIGELVGMWFKDYLAQKLILGVGVIVALVMLRIITNRFSPEPHH